MLTVHEPDSVSVVPLEDAMLIKAYQLAIAEGPMAGLVANIASAEATPARRHAFLARPEAAAL
jgi:hypothetical protein